VKTGKLRFAFSVIETKIMAKSKLKNTAITANDLTDFVANNSDFDFEMRVLEKLRSLNFACEYSGTCQDPVTDRFVNSIYAREKCKACVHWLLPLSVRISVLLIPCC
jgi:hypothetical protein